MHVLVELVRSADFARVLFVCAHGGNAEPLAAAVRQLRDEGHAVWAWSPRWDGDAHAGRVETSLLLALAPDWWARRASRATSSRSSALMARLRAGGVRAVAPNGVLGDPRGASAEEGRDAAGGGDRGPARVRRRARARAARRDRPSGAARHDAAGPRRTTRVARRARRAAPRGTRERARHARRRGASATRAARRATTQPPRREAPTRRGARVTRPRVAAPRTRLARRTARRPEGSRGKRVALVTGAARGIGAATVKRLVLDGWHVVAVDRAEDDPRLPYALGTARATRGARERARAAGGR